MTQGKAADPTVDELIATLARSRFPTVVVEGRDDIVVFRRFEEELLDSGITILPANGRDRLLQIFERRNEFTRSQRVAFIADRDAWIYSGVPIDFQSNALIFTHGYSIENDMFIDGDFENLLVGPERRKFERELEAFCRWYALAVKRYASGLTQQLRTHPNEVLDPSRFSSFVSPAPGETYPDDILVTLKDQYRLLLRGKSLFGLLLRHAKGFSGRSLLVVGASRRGTRYLSLLGQVQAVLVS